MRPDMILWAVLLVAALLALARRRARLRRRGPRAGVAYAAAPAARSLAGALPPLHLSLYDQEALEPRPYDHEEVQPCSR